MDALKIDLKSHFNKNFESVHQVIHYFPLTIKQTYRIKFSKLRCRNSFRNMCQHYKTLKWRRGAYAVQNTCACGQTKSRIPNIRSSNVALHFIFNVSEWSRYVPTSGDDAIVQCWQNIFSFGGTLSKKGRRRAPAAHSIVHRGLQLRVLVRVRAAELISVSNSGGTPSKYAIISA